MDHTNAGTPLPCAVVLCGGQGTRLRKVLRGKPKPMAPIAGVPFLDLLIGYLAKSGVRTIVLCTGYLSNVIEERYGTQETGPNILISRENRPLGTAGALKHAEASIPGGRFFVLNGDSICAADLSALLRFHLKKKALASLVLTNGAGRSDVGAVFTDRSGLVTRFSEKSGAGGLTNAGIYLFERKVLSLIPERRKYSLEYDLFPRLKNFYGFKSRKAMLDIGTPERYRKAAKVLGPKTTGGPRPGR